MKKLFIASVIEKICTDRADSQSVRVLDLGCGTAEYVPELLKKFPSLHYVGVEPIESSYRQAEKNLSQEDRAKLHFKLGYDVIPDEIEGSFDLVFSLSVLEHIKQLDPFIALSAKYLKKGGTMMHRYDLGHALHSHSLKERIHVFLGNKMPNILPERQFVRYVPEQEVRDLYTKNGVSPLKTTYHQMPNHKKLIKYSSGEDGKKAIEDLFAWEEKHQDFFGKIPLPEREILFPAVAVWGIKNN